jgi:hypothetical protein
MRLSRRFLYHASVLGLLFLGGCSGCSAPRGAREDTPPGPNRKQLLDEDRQITPEVRDNLPIRFGPIEIKVETRKGNNYYDAGVPWKRASHREDLLAHLRGRVAAKRPDLKGGRMAESFTVLLTYKDSDQQSCDSDRIELKVDGTPSPVPLANLGMHGAPVAATAELLSATWHGPDTVVPFLKKQGERTFAAKKKLTPQAPASLPIRFSEMSLDPNDKAGAFNGRLSWNVVGEWDSFYTLLDQATEKKPAAGNRVKSLSFIFTYRNAQGPMGTETVVLDMSRKSGTARLTKLKQTATLTALEITPVSVVWQGPTATVSLARPDGRAKE